MAEGAAYRVGNRLLQPPAKLAGKVGDVDETDLATAPQMIMDLGNRGDARSCVPQGIPNFLRLRAATLHMEQPHDGCEAVLDPVAHLPRQHGLVVEGFTEIRVGMLTLDGNAEQPGEAGKEVRIGEVELAWLRTIDFEDAERQVAFAAARNQDVDCAPDPMIGQELWCSKPRFLLEVIGNDALSGLESVAGGGFQVDAPGRSSLVPIQCRHSPAAARRRAHIPALSRTAFPNLARRARWRAGGFAGCHGSATQNGRTRLVRTVAVGDTEAPAWWRRSLWQAPISTLSQMEQA
jgi:hypothetical protein